MHWLEMLDFVQDAVSGELQNLLTREAGKRMYMAISRPERWSLRKTVGCSLKYMFYFFFPGQT